MAHSLEDVTNQFSVTRQHGSDLSVVMGNLLFKDLVTCVSELVTNSYDADAETVRIEYAPERDILSISDDGEGMDKQGLQGFYRMGESEKRRNPKSPKGRKRIGKYGIASLVLRTLAQQYTLDSWKDGMVYTVEEQFGANDTDKKIIEVQGSPGKKGQHGIAITMRKLNFLREDRPFDLRLLKRRLAVEMPVSPDFKIVVNETELKPTSIENGAEYRLEKTDDLIGPISGSLYYSSKPLANGGGIYIKVHGRAVGGTNFDVFGTKIGHGLTDRLFGVINADGLDDIIGFDRDNFLRDHPKFIRITEYITEILKQVRQDMEMDTKKSKVRKGKLILGNVVANVGDAVGHTLGEEGYKVVFDAEKAARVSTLDRGSKVLFVNPASPVLAVPKINEGSIRDALLNAFQHAVAREYVGKEGRAKFDHQMSEIAAMRLAEKKSLESLFSNDIEMAIYRVSPNRLYEYTEITRATGHENAVLKRLVSAGIIEDREGKLLGGEMLSLQDRISGYFPVFTAIREVYPEAENSAVFYVGKEELANRRLDRLRKEGALPSFILNLSHEGRPSFYGIHKKKLDSFKHFLATGEVIDQSVFTEQLYTFCKFAARGAGVAYALQLREFKDPNVVRESAASTLEFVKAMGEGALPPKVTTTSCYARHQEVPYVVGIYASPDSNMIRRLSEHFLSHDFRGLALPVKVVDPLFSAVVAQRNPSLPMSISTTFNPRYAAILEGMRSVR